MNETLNEIFESVLAGNQTETEDKARAALDENIDPGEILKSGLIAAMTEVGVTCPFMMTSRDIESTCLSNKSHGSGLD